MDPRPPSIAAYVLAVAVFAGCIGQSVGAPASARGQAAALSSPTVEVDPEAGTGTIEGQVVDDEHRPVADAHIEISSLGLATFSAADGGFRIEHVPVGGWQLRAESSLHRPRETNVSVERDRTSHVEFLLPAAPKEGAYHATVQFEGHYDCAHEIPIWTGDCMLLYTSQTGQNDTITSEKYAFHTPVEAGWESVVVELRWTYAANNQLDGMRLYLENGNGSETGHSYKVGRTDGKENPLRLVVNRGEAHPRADYYVGTGVKAYIPDAGQLVQIRVFPRGLLYSQTSQVCTNPSQQQGCLLGVGIGVDIRFTVYATVFYGARAPASFSAAPG